MFIKISILGWVRKVYVPLEIIRTVKTPLGCTFVARLLLLLFGLFCIFVLPILLTYENLPTRYKDLNFLGGIFHYAGIVIVVIAVCGLLQFLFRTWRHMSQ